MTRYAEPMARLIEELKKLPGVGTKSAQRFAFHILRSTDEDAAALAEAVRGLKASLRLCSICNNVTDVDPCAYCASRRATTGWSAWWKSRQISPQSSGRAAIRASIMCCTAHSRHCMAWGRISCAPDAACRVERGEVDEVILATSPTLEGEATAHWLATALRGSTVGSRA